MNKVVLSVVLLSGFAAFAEESGATTNSLAAKVGDQKHVCRDEGLERLFNEVDLKFRFVEDPGVYELTFSYDNGRTQLVIVDAKTER